MAKIIPIVKFSKTTRPMSPLMIKTLIAACGKQSRQESFGQADLDGSFMALLKRKFIDATIIVSMNGDDQVEWFVTVAGKNALKKLDFNGPC